MKNDHGYVKVTATPDRDAYATAGFATSSNYDNFDQHNITTENEHVSNICEDEQLLNTSYEESDEQDLESFNNTAVHGKCIIQLFWQQLVIQS
jgi:hypothetical protein